MTKIYSMSPGFLLAYKEAFNKGKVDMEEVFKNLSFEMGGDGNSITKKQLDDYISKADNGVVKLDKTRLAALKRIQKHWETISSDGDSITYSDFKNCMVLLAATMDGNFEVTEIEDKKNSIREDLYNYLTDFFDLESVKDVKKSHLESFLNELLSNDSSQNDNSDDFIAEIVNIIASSKEMSTIEKIA